MHSGKNRKQKNKYLKAAMITANKKDYKVCSYHLMMLLNHTKFQKHLSCFLMDALLN